MNKLIDYVFIINENTAIPAIRKLKPQYYCKGIEYKNSDNVGNLELEKKALYKSGGKLKFLGKNVQSSSRIDKIQSKPIMNKHRQMSSKIIKNT